MERKAVPTRLKPIRTLNSFPFCRPETTDDLDAQWTSSSLSIGKEWQWSYRPKGENEQQNIASSRRLMFSQRIITPCQKAGA